MPENKDKKEEAPKKSLIDSVLEPFESALDGMRDLVDGSVLDVFADKPKENGNGATPKNSDGSEKEAGTGRGTARDTQGGTIINVNTTRLVKERKPKRDGTGGTSAKGGSGEQQGGKTEGKQEQDK